MSGRLEGKVAVITGTGRGMARQIALRFAQEGASVVGCDIDAEAAEETVEYVRAAGGNMESLHPIDLTDEASAHRLFEFAVEKFGGVDIVDNNAMQFRLGMIESLSLDDWRLTLDHTLTLHFLTSKHAIPHLRARGGGSMFFMASISGSGIGPGFAGNLPINQPYSVAKAGVLRLMTCLANELAPWNIRVNAISPGTVDTEMSKTFFGPPGSPVRRVVEDSLLIDRLSQPDDIADAALFLASDESAFVTGLNLAVDNGYLAAGGGGRTREADVAAYAPKLAELTVPDLWETSGVRG